LIALVHMLFTDLSSCSYTERMCDIPSHVYLMGTGMHNVYPYMLTTHCGYANPYCVHPYLHAYSLVHLVSAIWGLRLWRTQFLIPAPLLSLARSVLLSVSQAGAGSGSVAAWASTFVLPSSISVADLALLLVSAAGIAQGVHNIVRVLGINAPSLLKEVCVVHV